MKLEELKALAQAESTNPVISAIIDFLDTKEDRVNKVAKKVAKKTVK